MSTSDQRTPEQAGGRQPKAASPPRRNVLATALIVVGAAILAIVGITFMVRAGEKGTDISAIPTAPVKRGPLTVSITQGGTLRAMESLEIKSEVEGNNQILEIVPEGTIITEEDVQNSKVLVRLDASELDERLANREISFASAEASLTQAREALEIRKKQNESNEARAALELKFARMELARYLGDALADHIVAQYGRPEDLENADFSILGPLATREVEKILSEVRQAGTENALQVEGTTAEEVLGAFYTTAAIDLDVSLGGMARQTVRDLASNVLIAGAQLSQQEDRLYWTRRLVEEEYENRSKLDEDLLSKEQRQVTLESAKEELRLFIRYTLPKDAEQRYSDYIEAQRELDRVEATSRSELAQAEANLKSKQATYNLEKERLEKTREMIEKSTIRATKPGVVVYASTSDPWRRDNNPIQEGANVRQNETLINLPNLSTLAARVNIHEIDISKIQEAQPARISVEALLGESFPATVARISPMASSEHRWLNPDTMVYETDVKLEGIFEGLSPGMSATAEIIVADLKDVLYVPVQAVSTRRGKRVCWVRTPTGPQMREVKTGYFTEKYVEIRDGLKGGETVFLAPPEEEMEAEGDEEATGMGEEETAEEAPEVRPAPPAETDESDTGAEEEERADSDAVQKARELAQKLIGMSDDERAQYFQDMSQQERVQLFQSFRNLPEAERQQLMQKLGFGGRPGAGAGGRGGSTGGGRPAPNQQ